jgi:hypothetical protein
MGSDTDYKLSFSSTANNAAGNTADTSGTPSLTSSPAPATPAVIPTTGTVTSVATGRGLTGGPITNAGTISFTGPWFFVADYANVQAAFTAACNAGGILALPIGITSNTTLTWPTNFAGSVTLMGAGPGVSTLSGSIQLVSNASPTVNLWGFGVTGGVAIDLNGSGYAGGQFAGSIEKVVVTGTISYAASTHAFYLNSFCQGVLRGLNAQGPGNTSGNGLTCVNCSNLQADAVTLYSFARGLNLNDTVAGEMFSNFRAVNCGYGIYGVLGANQAFQMTNWMVDNGNTPSNNLTTPCVYLSGNNAAPNSCILSNGIILQIGTAGPLYGLQLSGMVGCRLRDIDFSFCGASDSCIFISGTSSYTTVGGCKQPGGNNLVHVESLSTYNYAIGNTLQATFNNAGGATNQLLS